MTEQTLYLSNDKTHVMDSDGKVVYVRKEIEGKTFYTEPATEVKGKGKVCVGFSGKKVCVEWNKDKYCVGWGDIEVCVKWEYE